MLDASKGQLCSKLCRHNIRTPRPDATFLTDVSFLNNVNTAQYPQ